MKSFFLNHKIGAFEVLVAEIPLAVLFGNGLQTLGLIAVAALFYYTKKRYHGEFSLSDIITVVSSTTQEKETKRNE